MKEGGGGQFWLEMHDVIHEGSLMNVSSTSQCLFPKYRQITQPRLAIRKKLENLVLFGVEY